MEVGGPAGLVTDDRRLVMEPMHRPIARDHAVLRPEGLVGVARATVFGQDPLAILRVEDLCVQLPVGDPFLSGVAELGLEPAQLEEEAVDDQLTASLEKVGQARGVVRALESVLLIHGHSRHPAALGGQRITGVGQLLLLRQ